MTTEQLRALLELTADKDGRITPEGVVEAARDKDHPANKADDPNERLCAEFDFDLNRSAHRDWIEQARTIIRRVPIYNRVETSGGMKVPYYVRDPNVAPKEQGYVSLGSTARASNDARLIMAGELDRVESSLHRAIGISGQLQQPSVEKDLSKALAIIKGIRERLSLDDAA